MKKFTLIIITTIVILVVSLNSLNAATINISSLMNDVLGQVNIGLVLVILVLAGLFISFYFYVVRPFIKNKERSS